MSKAVIVIPTYNEKENVRQVVEYTFGLGLDADILIVDDSSPDGTADIVRELQAQFPGKLHLESRKGKLGLGTAYIHGFKWALAREYALILEMDADLSHPPDRLQALMDACTNDGAGLAIGSRYCKGGGVSDWSLKRRALSYFASLYVRIITWMPVKDPTAGFVCYTRETLLRINLDHIRFVGYAFQIEMKYAAWRLGFRIKEVPITFTDRVRGKSKMSMNIFREGFIGVMKMRFRKGTRRYYDNQHTHR